MPRLLVAGNWFESVSSNGYWETEYERLILQDAPRIFPGYIAVPFKQTVYSDEGSARADLALIAPDYQGWWVVEVELAHHSLAGHVLPQVRVLANAFYGDREASYLASKASTLDVVGLRQMMKGDQPRVLVIANRPVAWKEHLTPLGALLGIVEMYRSRFDQHVLRVDGEFPERPAPIVSMCRLDPTMARLLLIQSPGKLPAPDEGQYRIDFDGDETLWEPVAAKDRLWLNPVRTNPLSPGIWYTLTESIDGRLLISAGG